MMIQRTSRSTLPAPAGSGAWDAPVVAKQPADLVEFLESVARTEPIRTVMDRAIAALRLEPGERVLDIGCGTGTFLFPAAEAVGPSGLVVGLDHAPSLLAEARARLAARPPSSAVRLVVGDGHRLPFPRATFDAAHIERVLIHLPDPTAALRELRRVVRPGGRVVVVEPDLAGWRVDHVDPEAMRVLIAAFAGTFRQPAMGLELNRRLAAAGFVDRTVDFLTEFERDYPPDAAVYVERAADAAVAAGRLTRERADRALADLQAAGAAGTFSSYSSIFVVAGRVPDERPQTSS